MTSSEPIGKAPAEPATPLPLYLAATQPETRDRLTAGIRILMVIPQVIVLFFVNIAALFVLIVGWFAALITGQLPAFAREFLTGVVRWNFRVQAYFYFLTDQYPPFSLQEEPQYPVQIAVPGEAPLNRLAVLGRIPIAIPAAIVASVLSSGANVIAIGSWFMILFTGRMPRSHFEALRLSVRYLVRFEGYFWMLTAEYPWGYFGDADAPALTPEQEAAGIDPDPWRLRLSAKARPVMTALIVIGIILFILRLI